MVKLFALLVPRDGMTPLEFFGHWLTWPDPA
jgi:hypothetical protein